MASDGQGAADYGVHLLPEADWARLAECRRCRARAGHPCRDMRVKHLPARRMWTAHPGRQHSEQQLPPAPPVS